MELPVMCAIGQSARPARFPGESRTVPDRVALAHTMVENLCNEGPPDVAARLVLKPGSEVFDDLGTLER